MSDENQQPMRKDRPDQVKQKPIEHKAQQERPDEMIEPDERAPRGRRPLFRS